MSRSWTAFVVISSLWACVPSGAEAQTRSSVFLHGFASEASDWAATADRLKQRVVIQPHLPSLPWKETYEKQAKTLQGLAGIGALPTNTVVVGHSNGGVVAREWSRLRPFGGVVTIGTPHHGVPLLTHLPFWAAFTGTLRGLVGEVGGAFVEESEWLWVFPAVENALLLVSDFSLWSLVNLINVLGVASTTPVSVQMLPGSAYLSGLNASSQLSREASAVPNRVGIVSVASNYFYAGPARAIAPHRADTIASIMYATASTLLYWGNHILINAEPWDTVAMDQASALISVANQILAVDPTYCAMVSTLDLSGCVANDGILPVTSQAYPGAPNFTVQGPAHREEKQRSDDALYAALVTYMHLPPVTTTTSPPPSPSPSPSPGPAPGGGGEIITGGELAGGGELRPGDLVSSDTRRVHLFYQEDGNLVLYYGDPDRPSSWTALWSSDTAGTPPGVVIMQLDGNLVVYSGGGHPIWSTGTLSSGARLAVQDDGNLVVYDVNDVPLWASDTHVG